MAPPSGEGPGEKSQQSPFSSPSGGSRVPPRVQRWMERAQANSTRCSPFPGHVHVPGMTERENSRGEGPSSQPPHHPNPCPMPSARAGRLMAGNRTTPGSPWGLRSAPREPRGKGCLKCALCSPLSKQMIAPPLHPLCRSEWWLAGLPQRGPHSSRKQSLAKPPWAQQPEPQQAEERAEELRKVATVTPGSRVFPGQATSSTTLGIIHNKLRPRVSHAALWVQGPHLVEP